MGAIHAVDHDGPVPIDCHPIYSLASALDGFDGATDLRLREGQGAARRASHRLSPCLSLPPVQRQLAQLAKILDGYSKARCSLLASHDAFTARADIAASSATRS